MEKQIHELCANDRFIHLSTITLKLLKKTDLTSYTSSTNENRTGKWFRCLLLDSQGNFIEAISFAENQYNQLEVNTTYRFQAFEVQEPNRK
jgi:hypothetical protein